MDSVLFSITFVFISFLDGFDLCHFFPSANLKTLAKTQSSRSYIYCAAFDFCFRLSLSCIRSIICIHRSFLLILHMFCANFCIFFLQSLQFRCVYFFFVFIQFVFHQSVYNIYIYISNASFIFFLLSVLYTYSVLLANYLALDIPNNSDTYAHFILKLLHKILPLIFYFRPTSKHST